MLKKLWDRFNALAVRTKSFWYFLLGIAWGIWLTDTVIYHHTNRGALINGVLLAMLSVAAPWGFHRWEQKHGKVRNVP